MFSGMPDEDHITYEKDCLNLLREFAKFYQPGGPPHGHFSENASILSQKISRYVEYGWRERFAVAQFPPPQRKVFPQYNPNDPMGN